MKKLFAILVLLLFAAVAGWTQTVKLIQDPQGAWEMRIDGKQYFVKAVNWEISPPGTRFMFSLWNESDATIRKVLDTEAELMTAAGINAIKIGPDIPRKWVDYLSSRHGIYVIIHDVFDRWGGSVNGRTYNPTNYFVPELREKLLKDSLAIVDKFKNSSGVIMYMFGDGNGDALYWTGDDTQETINQFGVDPRYRKANALFSLLEQVFEKSKEIDPDRAYGYVTNDLGWVELITDQCPSMDFLGVNMNRGMQAGPDFWRDAKAKINKPVVIASIGSDAWNAKTNREDQYMQAAFTLSQWKDIYQNAYGNGYGNSLGGCVNEWTDNWYKSDY
ncbi:MAG: hypothetical protein FWF22_10235, partial [Treponema sp.]|nr:hypothetical protein [Treponema sp.]